MLAINRTTLGARFAAGALVGAVVFMSPLWGPSSDGARAASKGTAARPDDVEARIKTLHGQLRITADQETVWNTVAQAMRDNAKTASELSMRQAESERTATAPDMISAYGKTVDAHADAIKKFAATFEPLYDSMSDAQKKTADVVFRDRVHNAVAKSKS